MVPEPLHLGPVRTGMGRLASDAHDNLLQPVLCLPPRPDALAEGRPRGAHRSACEGRREVAGRPHRFGVHRGGSPGAPVEHGRMPDAAYRRGPDAPRPSTEGEHNIYISGGLGPLRGKTIRIGTMGTQADLETIDWLLKAIRASL